MSNRGRAIIAASLAFALGFGGVPAIAHADEPAPAAPATLDEAWATYGELSMKVAEVGESLNDTYYELGQAEQNKADLGVKIEASTARLDVSVLRRTTRPDTVLCSTLFWVRIRSIAWFPRCTTSTS